MSLELSDLQLPTPVQIDGELAFQVNTSGAQQSFTDLDERQHVIPAGTFVRIRIDGGPDTEPASVTVFGFIEFQVLIDMTLSGAGLDLVASGSVIVHKPEIEDAIVVGLLALAPDPLFQADISASLRIGPNHFEATLSGELFGDEEHEGLFISAFLDRFGCLRTDLPIPFFDQIPFRNNACEPHLFVEERVFQEGIPNLFQKIRVGLSEPVDRPLRVVLATQSGSATLGADYENRNLIVELSGGTPSDPPVARQSVVNVSNDGVPEGAETFNVVISRAAFLNDDESEGDTFVDKDTTFHAATMTIDDPREPAPVEVFVELPPPGGTVQTSNQQDTLVGSRPEDQLVIVVRATGLTADDSVEIAIAGHPTISSVILTYDVPLVVLDLTADCRYERDEHFNLAFSISEPAQAAPTTLHIEAARLDAINDDPDLPCRTLVGYDFDNVQGSGYSFTKAASQVAAPLAASPLAYSRDLRNFALQFDGVDDVVSGQLATIPANAFTIEFWMNPGKVTGRETIVSLGPSAQAGSQNSIFIDGATNQIGYQFDGLGRFGARSSFGAGSPKSADNWQHVAITFDGSTIRTYQNGVERLRQSASGPLTLRGRTLFVGAIDAAGTSAFTGAIDELRIWNRARSTGEIAAGMPQPILAPVTGLALGWGFDAGEGTTIADVSGLNQSGRFGARTNQHPTFTKIAAPLLYPQGLHENPGVFKIHPLGPESPDSPAAAAGGWTGNQFFEFTLTLPSSPGQVGQPLNSGGSAGRAPANVVILEELDFWDQRGTSGPLGWELRSSLDNFGAALAAGSTHGGASFFHNANVDLGPRCLFPSDFPVTFRLHGLATGNGEWSVDNLALIGTVTTADACRLPPVALPDSVVTTPTAAVTINVLGNDSDPDGGSLTVINFTLPAGGSLTPNGNGTFSYSPNGFVGTTGFTYTVKDNEGDTASTTVTIQVSQNHPPVASDVTVNVNRGVTQLPNLTLSATDQETPLNLLDFSLGAGLPAGVNASLSGRTLTVSSPTGFTTNFDIPFRVEDDGRPSGIVLGDDGIIHVVVNQPPTAFAPVLLCVSSGSTATVRFTLSAQDETPSNQLTYSPSAGVTFDGPPNSSGQPAKYTPPSPMTSPITLSFTAADPAGLVSASASFVIPICVSQGGGSGGGGQDIGFGAEGGGPNSYISGATVFLDANFNLKRDFLDLNGNFTQDDDEPLEPFGITTAGGKYAFGVPNAFDRNDNGALDSVDGNIVMVGGIVASTALPFETYLAAPADFSVVTPLTTLATELVRGHGMSVGAAVSRLRSVFELPNVDLATFDPIAATFTGDPNGPPVYAVHQMLAGLIADASRLLSEMKGSVHESQRVDEAQVIYATIADRAAVNAAPIDLTEPGVVRDLLAAACASSGLPVASDVLDVFAKVISELNGRVASTPHGAPADFIAELARLRAVAQDDVAGVLANVVAGKTTTAAALALLTGAPLANRIAQTQVGSIVPPILIVENAVVTEGDLGSRRLEFIARLTRASAVPISVGYRTLDGSAMAADGDYLPVSGTLEFTPGQTEQLVTVFVEGDQRVELDEAVFLELTNPLHTLLSTTRAAGLIRDDDDLAIPVSLAGAVTKSVVGLPVSLAIEAATAFGDSPVTVVINWGDGRTDVEAATAKGGIVSISGRHTFTDKGTFKLVVTIESTGASPARIERPIIVSTFALLDDPLQSGKMLVVGGTSGDDRIEFSSLDHGNTLLATLNKHKLGKFPSGNLNRIVAFGLDGDDTLRVEKGICIEALLDGGNGDDRLIGGDGRDILFGGNGIDFFKGRAGADQIFAADDATDTVLADVDDLLASLDLHDIVRTKRKRN